MNNLKIALIIIGYWMATLLIFSKQVIALEEDYVNGIPCGGYSGELGLRAKCDELESFFKKWEPKARNCNPEAQNLLGLKFSGSSSTWHKAIKWFKMAAERGYPPAQFELGIRYEYGEGVLQDYVYAHMWYNLSSSRGYNQAGTFRRELCGKMTSESIAKAQDFARKWKATPCKKER